MKIRTKLPLFIAIMMCLYLLGLLAMMAILTATSFQQTENMIALEDLNRALNAVDRETENLRSIALDYAKWDDTWAFSQGTYPQYTETNFLPETCGNLKLGFVAIFSADGTCLFSGHASAAGLFEADGEVLPSLQETPGLMRVASAGERFLSGDSGVILCQSSPITRNDGKGKAAGFLVVGRFFDDYFLRKLSVQTGVNIEFFAAGSAEVPGAGDFGPAGQFLEVSNSGTAMHAFQAFNVKGAGPAFYIRTSTDRAITRKGTEISISISIVSLCFTIVLAALSWFAFSRWLNQPLALMESILKQIDLDDSTSIAGKPFSGLEKRSDEIGRVSSALSAMHSRLGYAYAQIRKSNETLELQVAARTASLSAANHNLELYRRILENASEGFLVADLDGTITEVNDAQCTMAGFSRDELIGHNPRLMKSDRHDSAFYAAMWAAINTQGNWSGEVWNRRRSGEVYPKWLSITTIFDESNKPEKYVGVSTDISIIKQGEENLHQLAFYDPLTGLPNRTLFANRLEHTIVCAKRDAEIIGLLFLDLDHFKNINDTMGHAAGDDLLIKASARIKAMVREMDTVSRIGGDEFTIILDKLKCGADSGRIAEKIIDSLAEKFEIHGTDVYIGASIGIALFPKDGGDSETLLKRADMAMYYAKESGRGRWSPA